MYFPTDVLETHLGMSLAAPCHADEEGHSKSLTVGSLRSEAHVSVFIFFHPFSPLEVTLRYSSVEYFKFCRMSILDLKVKNLDRHLVNIEAGVPPVQTSDLDPAAPPKPEREIEIFTNIPSSSTASACSKHRKQEQNRER